MRVLALLAVGSLSLIIALSQSSDGRELMRSVTQQTYPVIP